MSGLPGVRYVKESLPDHGEGTHERIRVNGWGLFLADRIEGHDLSHFLFERQLVGVSLPEEDAGSRSSQDSVRGGEVGDGEAMFAEGLPLSLIRLKVFDSLPLGVNTGDLEARPLFPRIRPGRGGSVKGQIGSGVDVMVMVMPEIE